MLYLRIKSVNAYFSATLTHVSQGASEAHRFVAGLRRKRTYQR